MLQSAQKLKSSQESEVLLNITQKLADIRKNLGIEDNNDDLSEIRQMQNSFKTPSEESNQFEVDHNTFGKQYSQIQVQQKLNESYEQKSKQGSKTTSQRETFKSQIQIHQIPTTVISDEQQDKLREQIILLEDQLNLLREMGLTKDLGLKSQVELQTYKQNIIELEQKNTQLLMEVSHFQEKAEFANEQKKQLEKKKSIQIKQLLGEIQLQRDAIAQLEHNNKILMSTNKSSDKVKEYIETLESQLQQAQLEIQQLASRVSKEQSSLDIQKEERKKLEKNLKKEFDTMYKDEITELKTIIKKWYNTDEHISLQKHQPVTKIKKVDQKKLNNQTEVENEKLKLKIERLTEKLSVYENFRKRNQSISDETLKTQYERRIKQLTMNISKYSERCKDCLIYSYDIVHKLKEFFFGTIGNLQKELAKTKQTIVEDQSKVYNTFENLITSIYEEFGSIFLKIFLPQIVKEKQILINAIDEMKRHVREKDKEIIQYKARIKNYDFLLV